MNSIYTDLLRLHIYQAAVLFRDLSDCEDYNKKYPSLKSHETRRFDKTSFKAIVKMFGFGHLYSHLVEYVMN